MRDRIHTTECAERYNAAVRSRALWRQLWPHACMDCAARGCHVTKDVVTLTDITEECSRCMGSNGCPRCGGEDAFTNATHPQCAHCGWTFESPGEPQLPACSCQEVARG